MKCSGQPPGWRFMAAGPEGKVSPVTIPVRNTAVSNAEGPQSSTRQEKAWGGVFREPTDKRVELFSESVSFDRRLADDDIDGSIAHARMLADCGLMTVHEADSIAHVLEEIRGEIHAGRFEYSVSKEDIHLHIESALTARLGDTGRKLHTARSRNDQVATDLRLFSRRAIDRLDHGLTELQQAFLGFAEREQGLVIPAYTHMRRVQPARSRSVASWRSSFSVWSLMRCLEKSSSSSSKLR